MEAWILAVEDLEFNHPAAEARLTVALMALGSHFLIGVAREIQDSGAQSSDIAN